LAFSVVRQRQCNDCGVAALATAAACHGISVDYANLADAMNLDPDGTDLYTISLAASRIGLHPQGVKATYEGLRQCRLPAIAQLVSWSGTKHFVVLLTWAPDRVIIADPARGLRTLSRHAFRRRHSGYLLLLRRRRADDPGKADSRG
jgi:ABC-type bacteriocin/lantibiotic exporter with double-glycine peptidase domain